MHEVYQWPDSEPWVDIEAPILSDCIFWYDESLQKNPFDKNTVNDMYYLLQKWDMNKPYLREQSDELGKKLFELLS